jgi:hypothetical protein
LKGALRREVEFKKKKKPTPKELLQVLDPELASCKAVRQIKSSGIIKDLENFESRQVTYN